MIEDRIQLFLVAVPNGAPFAIAVSIQAALNRRYRLFPEDGLPPVHLTVERLNPKSPDELRLAKELIARVCARHGPFEMRVNGFSCFGPPFKSVNLRVMDCPELVRLSRDLNDELSSAGLEARGDVESWHFHISLINPNFALREWTDQEFDEACRSTERYSVDAQCTIDTLELWYPWYRPVLPVEAVFRLSND